MCNHLVRPLATDCTRASRGSQVTINYENRNGDFCSPTTDSTVSYNFVTIALYYIFVYVVMFVDLFSPFSGINLVFSCPRFVNWFIDLFLFAVKVIVKMQTVKMEYKKVFLVERYLIVIWLGLLNSFKLWNLDASIVLCWIRTVHNSTVIKNPSIYHYRSK